jgi:hypothetical protein
MTDTKSSFEGYPSTPRVMAEAVTRTLGGSAACPREAEPPQSHDLAEPSHEENEETKSRGTMV